MTIRLSIAVALSVTAGACATYRPAPVDPSAFPASYASRSIGDSAFLAYRHALHREVNIAEWYPEDYAFAALYFRAGLDEARAQVRVAEAAERTAGARDRPGLAGSGERNVQHSDEKSPWGVQLTPTFVLETGGKRAARIAIAKAKTLAATARLHIAAWQIANEAREAAIASLSLSSRLAAADREREKIDSLLPLVEARFTEGGLSRTEVTRALAESDLAHVEALRARSEWRASLGTLATVSGLPPGGVPDIPAAPAPAAPGARVVPRLQDVTWPENLPNPFPPLPRDSVRKLALASRWEVAEALAEYQVAEGEVRLAVAEQRPDLQFGPGLFFDHGVTRFLVNFALPFLPGGNHGRIAEAEERRRASAIHLEAAQEAILAEADQASERYIIAGEDRDSIVPFVRAATEHREAVTQSFDRGEIGRLEMAQALLQDARAGRALTEFESKASVARAALETATGFWFTEGDAVWPDVLSQPVRPPTKEQR